MNGIENEFIQHILSSTVFNMAEDNIGYEELFVQGSNDQATLSREDLSKPLVLRGIVKRKQMNQCKKDNRTFFYIDTGYFGNFPSEGNTSGKKRWHRVVKNDLQHTFIRDVPSDRWQNLVHQDKRLEWRGWKTKGSKILLVIPNGKSCVFYDHDVEVWKKNTIDSIKQYTDMPIEIREKGSRSYRNSIYSIYDAFDSGIFATVTFNSIAAMESVAYGIPAFVTVPCAATPLASTDITKILTPFYPDENLVKKQCYNLAYGQFTAEELRNGTAWKLANL